MSNRPVNFNSIANGQIDQEAMLEAFNASMPKTETVQQEEPPVTTPDPKSSFISDTFSELLAAAEMEDQMIREMGAKVETPFDPITQPIQEAQVMREEQPEVIERKVVEPVNNTVSTPAVNVELANDLSLQDMLQSISIDVNNIEISSAPLGTFKMSKRVKDAARPVTQIVACQSAYKAFMSALSSQEIQNLLESDTDFYTFKKMVYQLVHKHAENPSIGKMDFPTFLKNTSFFDIETFLYGIYCQTFPYENKYTLTCPAEGCEKDYPMIVNNSTLVETRGQNGIFERIDEVVSTVKSPKDLEQHSLLYKVKRLVVSESKMIAEIQIPSLYDYLEGVLANTDRKFAEEYAASMGLSLFIRKLYVPDLVTLKKEGKLTYFELTDKKEITMAIAELSYYDSLELSDSIDEYTNEFKVSYTIKNVTCPHCAHVIKEVPINIENMLFHVIRQGRPKKDENNEQDI